MVSCVNYITAVLSAVYFDENERNEGWLNHALAYLYTDFLHDVVNTVRRACRQHAAQKRNDFVSCE